MNDVTNHAYLDYAASTPLDPRVKDAMDAVAVLPGNPSSTHAAGRALRAAIDRGRRQVADLLGVDAADIAFTSGATESNNAALFGVVAAARRSHPDATLRVVVSAAEHSSIVAPAERLAADGVTAARISDGVNGIPSEAEITPAIDANTVAVCMMRVNNVLGLKMPVSAVAAAVAAERARRGKDGLPIAFVCDAVQAMRTENVRPLAEGIDILTLSAHKMYGPKGVGAMWVRPGTPFAPLVVGGGQESGVRSGTENAAGIAGFGAASAILAAERANDVAHAVALHDTLLRALREHAPHARIALERSAAVPGIAFLFHASVPGDELALRLDAAGFAVSAGSACDAGKRRVSSIIRAAFGEQAAQRGGVRVSFGRFTATEDVERCVRAIAAL